MEAEIHPFFFWLIMLEIALFAMFCLWLYVVFFKAPDRANLWRHKMRQTLMPDEEVVGDSMQCRSFALFARRDYFAVTTYRAIKVRRHLFGGFNMVDLLWKNLQDAQISENSFSSVRGSNILFKTVSNDIPIIYMHGIPNHQAVAMYSKAESEEVKWIEQRRLRSLEEKSVKRSLFINEAPDLKTDHPTATH